MKKNIWFKSLIFLLALSHSSWISHPNSYFKQNETLSPSSNMLTASWMSDVFLVISDITDTLIDGKEPPSAKVKEVLQELLDLGVVFVPLTGTGRGTVQKRFLNHLKDLSHIERMLLGVQNGGAIYTLDTNEIISEKRFSPEIAEILREKISSVLPGLLAESGDSAREWYFQPGDDRKLKSILYVSFEEDSPTVFLLNLGRRLESKLMEDPQIKSLAEKEGKPFDISFTGRHIAISARNKVESIGDIIEQARKRSNSRGNTVLILGNSGGDQGQDAEMLLLRNTNGVRVRSAYVGTEDLDWARANAVMTVPETFGPAASTQILKEIAKQVRGHHRERIIGNLKWNGVRPEYQRVMEAHLVETQTLDQTLQFFNVTLSDIQSGEVRYLGQGNENYASQVSLTTFDAKIINFLLVVPHRKITEVHHINHDVDHFLNEYEKETLLRVTREARDMPRRRFPILINSEDGIFTRELFEGEEVGKFIRELSGEKELENVLYACSLSQIDFWAHATQKRWMPMVHDDDIIVSQVDKDRYHAYLPDLGTPVYHAPAFRVFMEIFYLNYELVQIFNEKVYGRHILLWPREIRMLFPIILQAFLDSLGVEEGEKVILEILENLQEDQISVKTRDEAHHFSSFALRFHIERFLQQRGLRLPTLPYGRPSTGVRLTWSETTSVVDGLREYIPIDADKQIQSLKLPRPYDDRSQVYTESGVLEKELRWYKAKAKTFERVSEIILGMSYAPISESKKFWEEAFNQLDGEKKDTSHPSHALYVYRILDYYEGQGMQYLHYPQMLEVLYGLFFDFNLVGTIPGDWMRLFHLVQYRYPLGKNESPLQKLNIKTRIPNQIGKQIYLHLNKDLGKAALLWHAASRLKNVHAFSVFVDGDFAGVLDFSFSDEKLIVERFRLNKRGMGLGTAIVSWLQEYALKNGINSVETFEFVHFLHVHVLSKLFSSISVYQDGEWVSIKKSEAQKLAIKNPTGYRFRFKLPEPTEIANIDPSSRDALNEAI